MKFPKCGFCKYSLYAPWESECATCSFGGNFELRDLLTAREQMEWMKLAAANDISSGKKLIGSIMDGYSYVDTDVANTMQMAANQIIKQELNNIYGKKKEERNMKAMDIYNLTKNNGMATITAGDISIPVRITDVEHESRIYSADTTTITCEVQHVPAPLARRASKVAAKKRSDLIKNVYFNDPVTVVIWTDGSRTIVKANGDEPYDPEKGLAMAIAKKFIGDNESKSNYYDVFKKWLPKEKKVEIKVTYTDGMEQISEGRRKTKDRWKIWVTHLDTKTGEVIGRAAYPSDYSTKYAAERAAKRMYGPDPRFTKWIVSKTNPWETEEK